MRTTAYPDGLPIGETWLEYQDSSPVRFPFDGTVIGQAPWGNTADASSAVDFAAAVAPVVAALSAGRRRRILHHVASALTTHKDQLIDLLVLETGKPLVDCRRELDRSVATWTASAEEVAQLHGETVPLDVQQAGEGMFGYWTRQPAGVVVGITGFNYPLLLASHKLAPALAAGCPVIVKPAPQTPLSTLWLVHLIRQALASEDVPLSAVQAVTGGVDVGETLVSDARVAVVSFTGSAAVGHQIARSAAPRKAVLELGSNAAMIIAADADLPAAVDAVLRGGFYASGQACISVQRVIVEAAVADEFETALVAAMPQVIYGDPRAETTRVAPLTDAKATSRVHDWLAAASNAGARTIYSGAGNASAANAQLPPTVIADVPVSALAWREEIFGPVVCLRSVPNFEAAITLANDSRYGLQAAVFTSSLKQAMTAINRLEVGGVVVNDVPGFRSDIMPYGGIKDSGIGREGPRFAIEELTVTKMAIIRP